MMMKFELKLPSTKSLKFKFAKMTIFQSLIFLGLQYVKRECGIREIHCASNEDKTHQCVTLKHISIQIISLRETVEGENFGEFRGFVAIRENFSAKLGGVVSSHERAIRKSCLHKNHIFPQFTKVFPLEKFLTIQYQILGENKSHYCLLINTQEVILADEGHEERNKKKREKSVAVGK